MLKIRSRRYLIRKDGPRAFRVGTGDGLRNMKESYAQQAYKAFGDGPFTVVETTIPTRSITPDMRVMVDRSMATVIVPTQTLSALSSPQVLSYTPLPRR